MNSLRPSFPLPVEQRKALLSLRTPWLTDPNKIICANHRELPDLRHYFGFFASEKSLAGPVLYRSVLLCWHSGARGCTEIPRPEGFS